MSFSTFSTTVLSVLFLLFLSLTVSAQSPDPSSSITLSFNNFANEPVPSPNATMTTGPNNCLVIPSLANAFTSSSTQSVLAIYQDENCQSYLYSVTGLLANVHGAKGLKWTFNDPTHALGETFTDPDLTGLPMDNRHRVIQIILLSTAGAVVFLGLGVYLCIIDNRRNRTRGGRTPEPPTFGRKSAEASRASGVYPSRGGESTASSVSYLPAYAEGPTKTLEAASGPNVPGITRTQSISMLTNKVGTGAGLDPGSAPQGRNAGFGLGYDLEEYKRRDTRRDSDAMMREAMMTPPHSPSMRPRPSSMISDDGHYLGRSSLSGLRESTTVQIPA